MEENFCMGWNGGFLVWNVNKMEKNCQYGIRKNRLPFNTMPFRQHKSNKITYKVNLRVFFLLNAISCFILSRDVEAVEFCGSGSKKLQRRGSELGSIKLQEELEAEALKI